MVPFCALSSSQNTQDGESSMLVSAYHQTMVRAPVCSWWRSWKLRPSSHQWEDGLFLVSVPSSKPWGLRFPCSAHMFWCPPLLHSPDAAVDPLPSHGPWHFHKRPILPPRSWHSSIHYRKISFFCSPFQSDDWTYLRGKLWSQNSYLWVEAGSYETTQILERLIQHEPIVLMLAPTYSTPVYHLVDKNKWPRLTHKELSILQKNIASSSTSAAGPISSGNPCTLFASPHPGKKGCRCVLSRRLRLTSLTAIPVRLEGGWNWKDQP